MSARRLRRDADHRSGLHARRGTALATWCLVLSLATLAPVARAGAASRTTFATESASKIMSATMSAATTKGSCTWSSSTRISGQSYSSVTDSATTSGQQTQKVGNAQIEVRVVGGVLYFDDNAQALQAQFGVNAPRYVHRWIMVPPTNERFTEFGAYILLKSMLSEVVPTGTLSTTKTTKVLGRAVVGVSGHPNIRLGLASGTETLYVATEGAHVPVELVASDGVASHNIVITFSHWGSNFNIARPAKFVAISATTLPS